MKRWVKVGRGVAIAISAGMAVWATETRGQTASAPATLPQAVELQAILTNLASADFDRREAGQKELKKVPADRYAEVVALAAGQADAEVKARLDLRTGEMLVELKNKPTPTSTRALLGLLTNKDAAIRDGVIVVLSNRIGNSTAEGGSDEILPALAKALPEVKDEHVRASVCSSANQYLKPWAPAKKPDATRGPQAAEMLRERLKNDPSDEVRFWAACGLAEFGDKASLPELEKNALAMQSGDGKLFGTGDELFWVDVLVPAIEQVTGQKFTPPPAPPNLNPVIRPEHMPGWEDRRAKLDLVVAWMKAHPSTVPATTK
jgi:hypothetical protein